MDFFDHEKPSAAAKTRDYRNVFIIQSALIFVALFLAEIIRLCRAPMFTVIHDSVYTALGATYFYLVWDLLKNFLRRKAVIVFLFLYLITLFLIMLVLQNPFLQIVKDPSVGFTILHLGLLSVEFLTISLVFKDVFSSHNITKNNLWGAVSLFLMIAISFASIFELLNLIEPLTFGVALSPGFATFSEMLYCSLVAISGGTPTLPAQSQLVRNVIAVESLGGNLYLVILIGRIVGMVAPSKN